jgi:hypothetical protein
MKSKVFVWLFLRYWSFFTLHSLRIALLTTQTVERSLHNTYFRFFTPPLNGILTLLSIYQRYLFVTQAIRYYTMKSFIFSIALAATASALPGPAFRTVNRLPSVKCMFMPPCSRLDYTD